MEFRDPGANRTRNPQLRRLMLYPIELRDQLITRRENPKICPQIYKDFHSQKAPREKNRIMFSEMNVGRRGALWKKCSGF